jgi:hypothetical protein
LDFAACVWIQLLRYNFGPNMSSSPTLPIEGLFSADATVRAAAAAEIYHQGGALSGPAVSCWLTNRGLYGLLFGQPVTVGLAVFPVTFTKIRHATGNPQLTHVPPDQDAKEFELHFPAGVSLDILTTRDAGGTGAIGRFLKKFGEGIQQVEYRCLDVDRATAILREEFGLTPVYPQARAGADDTRINFFLVRASDGGRVLIELYETAAAG